VLCSETAEAAGKRQKQDAMRKLQRPDRFAANVLPIVSSIRASGVESVSGLARALNNRGVRAPRGGKRHVSSVSNLLKRHSL
jgi:hypothetical protein